MNWTPFSLCLTLLCFIGSVLSYPVSDTKNDLKDIVSSLIERTHDQGIDREPQVPAEVAEDVTDHDRKLNAAFEDGADGIAPEAIAKRGPWYNARSFYDGSKRFGSFDSINHYSNFGKFQKRKNGISNEAAEGLLDRLKRGGFDSIHHFSDFGRFNKRSVDRAAFARGYADQPHWKRRAFDSIHHYSDFGRFSRRK